MEAVREIIDSNLLNGIIDLPNHFRNQQVEVTIFLNQPVKTKPLENKKKHISELTKADIDEMFENSIVKSLIGIIPDTGKTLEEYRAERLKKYERVD